MIIAPSSHGSLFPLSQKQLQLSTQQGYPFKSSRGDANQFLEQAGRGGKEFQHLFQPLPRIRASRAGLLELADALLQDAQGGVNLAALSFFRDNAENFPNVFHGFKMVPAV